MLLPQRQSDKQADRKVRTREELEAIMKEPKEPTESTSGELASDPPISNRS